MATSLEPSFISKVPDDGACGVTVSGEHPAASTPERRGSEDIFGERVAFHRVNLTLIGGDLARTALPARSRAGVNPVFMAQATAAFPNPCPGSTTISADSAEPLGSTTTRMTTVCSSIRSDSASGGHGQDQL
jgi:hypothetical protein